MTDRDLIMKHGGPAALAELLKFRKPGGVQRVQNWMTRGIPAKVKLDHPDLFLSALVSATDTSAQEGAQ